MTLNIKKFEELSNKELYNILKLRSEVFVVEQKCNYVDMDGIDEYALHIFYTENDEITAYLRLFPLDKKENTAKIGRVISAKRRSGLGTLLLKEGINAAKYALKADKLIVEAQSYVKDFYAKQGFVQTSGEFLDVGIPHVKMELAIWVLSELMF